MIEYRFRVSSAAVFTLYSYSKALEYRFRVPTAASLHAWLGFEAGRVCKGVKDARGSWCGAGVWW
jgi:hypothetical protein